MARCAALYFGRKTSHSRAMTITPSEIRLKKDSKLLIVSFDDGSEFQYSCEYLRVIVKSGTHVQINAGYVDNHLAELAKDEDLSRYIL